MFPLVSRMPLLLTAGFPSRSGRDGEVNVDEVPAVNVKPVSESTTVSFLVTTSKTVAAPTLGTAGVGSKMVAVTRSAQP